ncbi:MAG: tetratricopeptide repeat protein [Candidatus Hermodarchaeota archaeon]
MATRYYWHPAPQTITLETLFHQTDRFCFLAGSGISLDPPSCLPTAYQFSKTLIRTLIPETEYMAILTLMEPEREGLEDPSDVLRFEHLMTHIKEYDANFQSLDYLMNSKTPNFNHYFLAQMLAQGHPVFTTNFDSLIEYAFLEANLPSRHLRPVIYQNEWEAEWKSNLYLLYKLHGSFFDVYQKKDSQDSIQVILNQIVQNKGAAFQLEPWKRRVLSSILQERDLVVLGYSGIEDFDVLPTLWHIPSSKRVLWITHDKQLTPTQAKIEIIQARKFEGPMMVPQLNRIRQNLIPFTHIRPSIHIYHIRVHTRQLLEWLWQQYLQTVPPMIESRPCPKDIDLSSSLKLTKVEKWLLTGDIFSDCNLFEQAIKAYQRALELAQEEKDRRQEGKCLNSMALLFHKEGHVNQALRYYQEAFNIDKELGDRKKEALFLYNNGLLLYSQGRLNEALDYYQQALGIYNEVNDINGVINTLNSLGHLLYSQGRLNEALNYYQRVLDLADRLGNLRIKTSVMNNIGQIFYNQGQIEEALKYYQQGLDVAEQMGNLDGKITLLTNIGFSLFVQDQIKKGLEYYQEAINLHEQLGYIRDKAIALGNIGKLFFDRGNLNKALEYYNQALEIHKQAMYLEGQATIQTNIGEAFFAQQRFDEALDAYQEALVIFERLENPKGKAAVMNNIGRLHYERGHLAEALQFYEQSLAIDDESDDPNEKMARLISIATLLFDQERFDEALTYYQQCLEIVKALAEPKIKATVLNNIAQLLHRQERFDEALEHYEQAIFTYNQLDDPKGKITVLNNFGQLLLAQQRFKEALDCFEQVLDTQKGNIKEKAFTLLNIGKVFEGQNEVDEAIKYFKQALNIFELRDDRYGKVQALSRLGILFYHKRRWGEALEHCNRARALASGLNVPDLLKKIDTVLEEIKKRY